MSVTPRDQMGRGLEDLAMGGDLAPGVARRSWADAAEIDTFDQFVDDFWAGRVDPDGFRKFRLRHGVCGQRQKDVQMIRVRIPWGGLSAAQLQRLADVADRTQRGVGHVTTRQNVQFHFVPLAEAPAVMRALGEVGLTTREAGGNTVRNVAVGHCAGVCPRELFDPPPYADAVARFLLRNPMNQNLPRKFKIAFSGCPDWGGDQPFAADTRARRVRGLSGAPRWRRCRGGPAPSPRPGASELGTLVTKPGAAGSRR